jgi:hypothetical protein
MGICLHDRNQFVGGRRFEKRGPRQEHVTGATIRAEETVWVEWW